MTELITNLSNVIHPDLSIPIIHNEVVIKEDTAECKKVSLKSTTKSIFAFSLDSKVFGKCKMFPFFCQTLGNINKVNDGIIFYKKGTEIFVFLIELKSNNLGEYKKQLQAGKNFLLYIINIINSTYDKTYKLNNKNIKCLVFSTRKSPQKHTTSRRNVEYKHINGLYIAEFKCNDTHYMEKFL